MIDLIVPSVMFCSLGVISVSFAIKYVRDGIIELNIRMTQIEEMLEKLKEPECLTKLKNFT